MSTSVIRGVARWSVVGFLVLFVLIPLLGYIGSLIVQAITGSPPSALISEPSLALRGHSGTLAQATVVGAWARSEAGKPAQSAYGPLPTVRLTFAPCFSRVPGLGFWAITCPFLPVGEGACLSVPTEQLWDLIETLAAAKVLPVTLGTTHFFGGGGGMRAKVALTEVSVSIDTLQAAVPVQAPLQPVKVEPATGVAVRVIGVPWR